MKIKKIIKFILQEIMTYIFLCIFGILMFIPILNLIILYRVSIAFILAVQERIEELEESTMEVGGIRYKTK